MWLEEEQQCSNGNVQATVYSTIHLVSKSKTFPPTLIGKWLSFDNKANRTIIFPVNQLHAAFYDLTAWPENVAERLTLNIVVRIGS